MSIEAVELLRKRSSAFARYAHEAFGNGDYDLAIFFAEQSIQLRLKSLILRILGFVPRTHSARELLGILIRSLEKLGRDVSALRRVAEESTDGLRLLEEAYTGSRCLARVYDRGDAEKALKILEHMLKVLDAVERGLFNV